MVSISDGWSRRLLTPSHPLRGCGSEVMTTQRRFLVVLMTTLMLAASLAGCLGGDDGGSDPDPGTDNGGTTDTGTSDTDGDGVGDACDADAVDSDLDGISDAEDLCPLDRDPTNADSDGDGIGDVCDEDADIPGLATERLGTDSAKVSRIAIVGNTSFLDTFRVQTGPPIMQKDVMLASSLSVRPSSHC